MLGFIFLAVFVNLAVSEVYFQETFTDGDAWRERWIQSKYKKNYGEFRLDAGNLTGNESAQKGLQTTQDNRFYSISSKFPKVWKSTKDSDLIVLFTVKHAQDIECGGGYIKLLPSYVDPIEFKGESDYLLMFGPDICGPDKKVHVIMNYKKNGKYVPIRKEIMPPVDKKTHLYKFVLKADQTYSVYIDDGEVASGSILEDWNFLPPKTIKDPSAKKPADWVEEKEIDDPYDKKPASYNEAPEFIVDVNAVKPEEWDEEKNGPWTAPEIRNPEYKEWKPRKIKNPAYAGPWVAPEIPNPDYKDENDVYVLEDLGLVGLDLWQVKTGSVFDNFLVTDDEEYAEQFVAENVDRYREDEAKVIRLHEEAEKKQREQEMKKRRREMKNRKKQQRRRPAYPDEEEDDEEDYIHKDEL